jgi:hypothetical protein
MLIFKVYITLDYFQNEQKTQYCGLIEYTSKLNNILNSVASLNTLSKCPKHK